MGQRRSAPRPSKTPAVGVYLLGVTALTSHLFHGLWSLTQLLGATTTRLNEAGKRRLAAATAIAIGIGYASMPLAVLTGILDYQ